MIFFMSMLSRSDRWFGHMQIYPGGWKYKQTYTFLAIFLIRLIEDLGYGALPREDEISILSFSQKNKSKLQK